MKRARDVREQLEGLMQRVEIDIISEPLNIANIRKVSHCELNTMKKNSVGEICMLYTH